jgi:hypothetical protein
LFFDEAEALFGKHTEVKDAHDRYASVDSSELLRQVSKYRGIVIALAQSALDAERRWLLARQLVVRFRPK